MKKLLLGSTALIGAAAFTAPALADATIEFSGNINYRYNYTDNGGSSNPASTGNLTMMTVPISIIMVPIWY